MIRGCYPETGCITIFRRTKRMSKAVKYAEKALTVAARGAWVVFDKFNQISPNASFTPKWSDKPLLKSLSEGEAAAGLAAYDRLALPEMRAGDSPADLDGKLPHELLLNEKVGEIKAQIIERDGKILMVKDCRSTGTLKT